MYDSLATSGIGDRFDLHVCVVFTMIISNKVMGMCVLRGLTFFNFLF